MDALRASVGAAARSMEFSREEQDQQREDAKEQGFRVERLEEARYEELLTRDAVAKELHSKLSVGDCLLYLRQATGQKNADVARGTGINQPNYTRYVAGTSVPSRETLTRIIDFFAEHVPALREGQRAREHIFTLRAIHLGRIPESLDGPAYVKDLLQAFESVRARLAKPEKRLPPSPPSASKSRDG
jgi:transcriptional regulator with XRE-family HTH domain